jgi:hypothetical protein
MILHGDSPGDWLTRHRSALFPDHDADVPHELVTTDALVESRLAAQVASMVAQGSPAKAAGTYLSGWYPGLASSVVALAVLYSDAGFLLRGADLRWWVHPEHYPDALEISDPQVVVLPDHPWAGQDGVLTVHTREELAARTTAALLDTLTPIVDVLAAESRAGRPGLWHEVADLMATGLAYQDATPPTPAMVTRVRELLDVPGTPWRRKPRLELLDSPRGQVCVVHKGGCCLAYTDHGDHEHEPDEDHAAFELAFPRPAGAPDYCVTCTFRPYDETCRMQLWWREREAGV